ncbi:MAG: hypothetical protein WDO17_16340 [Alphaproteobacteria bacterium]
MRVVLLKWAFSLSSILLLTMPAHAQAPAVPEPDPHGAVLCSWHIYLMMKNWGDTCFPSERTEFKLALSEAIEKIEAFIMASSPATQRDIERARSKMSSDTAASRRRLGRDACTALDKERYRYSEAQGASAIRDDITKLLAVPRKPVMNPCL